MATLQPGEKARMYALGGIMRGGASRGGYVSNRVYVNIDGYPYVPPAEPGHKGILIGSLTIQDELDATPNTCSFRVNGAVPAAGCEVRLTRGSTNSGTPLFAGYALTVNQIYAADKPANIQAELACVDYTWLFGFVKATKSFRYESATNIAIHLIGTYAVVNGFTTSGIAPDLPVLDEITFSNEDLDTAFTRLARRIGGYWYVDYNKGVHLFLDEPQLPAPQPLSLSHTSLDDFQKTSDRTQVLTRVYVEGRGTTVLTPVPVGETHVPVQAVDMFAPVASDMFLKVSPQGSDGGAQWLQFTGGTAGSGGALVGPGIGPTTAPTVALASGAGVNSGAHSYGVTYVTSGSGESLLSPLASIITGRPLTDPLTPLPQPTNNPTGVPAGGSFMTINDQVTFAYAYSTYAYDTPSIPIQQWPITLVAPWSPPIALVSNNDYLNPNKSAPVYVRPPASSDTRVRSVLVWMRSSMNGSKWGFLNTAPNVPPGAALVTTGDRGYPVYDTGSPSYYPLPTANTTGTENRVQVSTIPKHGTTSVTARKLYRTAADAAQLKLLATIADNTTTTYLDSTPDASLGVNAPIADTSGLQPAGQVPAGSTELVVSGTGAFEATGGWAIVGNGEMIIRYQGISSTALIGIPPSGTGSITATLAYNSVVSAPPMVTGVSGITIALVEGDELYVVVQVDDPSAQTALASALHVGPGIREEWISDRQLTLTEARARGQTTLIMRPIEEVTIRYRCRDTRTASGRLIFVNLPAPTNVSGTYRIQQVTIDNFRPYPNQPPTYTVTASSRRFSFEDWLRRMETKE